MGELVVQNTNGFEITTCDDFEETEKNLILYDKEGDKKGWIPQNSVKRILPEKEIKDTSD